MKENSIKITGPQISVVGANYTTTPLHIREKLSIPRSHMNDAFESLRNYVPKGVILATCNRTEIYAIDDKSHFIEQALHRFLVDWSGISEDELAPYLYRSRDYIAMRHLTRAAAGLYSMIIGEYEILGQVKQALDNAQHCEMVNLPLRNLFQHAIRTGRRVRDETEISRNALSVSSVAVDLATKVIGDIGDCKVLLIGAGEAGKLVARALTQRGISQLTVASRSPSSAQQLAENLGGDCVNVNELYHAMLSSDIVISCTGSPHYIVHQEAVADVMSRREERPLVIVDIAVPRDVEPEVKHIKNVYAYDIDALDGVSEQNRKEREKEVEKAMHIVDEEMENLVVWWQALEAKPTITALKQRAEEIRQHQLQMGLKKMPSLSTEEQEAVDAMTNAIINKLLHNPIKCLRENVYKNGDLNKMVYELFDLEERGSN